MKLYELAIGQKFIYQDQTYTKTTPMVAVDENGKQIFIRRSADVTLVVGEESGLFPSPRSESQTIEVTAVLETFDRFFQECKNYLDSVVVEQETDIREQALQHLETARQQFIDDISTQ